MLSSHSLKKRKSPWLLRSEKTTNLQPTRSNMNFAKCSPQIRPHFAILIWKTVPPIAHFSHRKRFRPLSNYAHALHACQFRFQIPLPVSSSYIFSITSNTTLQFPTSPLQITHSHPYKPINPRPRQHKTTQSPQHIPSRHQIPQYAPKIHTRLPLTPDARHKKGYEKRAEDVEREAGIGFEAENAAGDTEERGGEGAEVC